MSMYTDKPIDAAVPSASGERERAQAAWRPGVMWHLRVLAVIYLVLIIVFFTANHLLKPYLRQIPSDLTPWLRQVPAQESVG